jgi:predicted nucleic acid-binding Zn ribbon protein
VPLISSHLLSVFILSFTRQENNNMSGRKKARPSFNEYPAGRKPRDSMIDKEQVHYSSNEMTEQEHDSESFSDDEELERRRKRERLAVILFAICLLVIVLIIIIISLFGTSDADGSSLVPSECVISNETAPATYKEFECDMMATFNTQQSTYLRTFTSDTPHGKTIGWMTHEDDTDFSNTPMDVILERYVMALIYFGTVSNA